MSQRDGFSSGFLLGTLVGGIVGGVVGALLTAKQFTAEDEALEPAATTKPLNSKSGRRKAAIKPGRDSADMESARRSLEDKIAQLNEAIDDVRQQLGGVNGNASEGMGQPSSPPENRL